MKNFIKTFLLLRFFRSIIFCIIGLTPLTFFSIWFILYLSGQLGDITDGWFTLYSAESLIVNAKLEKFGTDFAYISAELFTLLWKLNLSLLIVSVVASIAWSTYSHYLNIDAPGKAKIYFIHWIIFTGIFMGILFGINYRFVNTEAYDVADFISMGGGFQIYIFSMFFYFVSYFAAVILGTARFARSSVLFANKLPGNL